MELQHKHHGIPKYLHHGLSIVTGGTNGIRQARQALHGPVPLGGPRYYSEARGHAYQTELDAYSWFGKAGLPATENCVQEIASHYEARKQSLVDLFGQDYEYSRAKPPTIMGMTFEELGGKTLRALTFGGPDKVLNPELDHKTQDETNRFMANLSMIDSEPCTETTIRTAAGGQMRGADSVQEPGMLRRLMFKLYNCRYEI